MAGRHGGLQGGAGIGKGDRDFGFENLRRPQPLREAAHRLEGWVDRLASKGFKSR